ncbi:MAG: ABC transporter permease [Marivibrio sp.]|uniref:ABC transporter permease n=1 Tax=Marivibrio sp. TaxID=2039719 RepID=UPI0032ED2699
MAQSATLGDRPAASASPATRRSLATRFRRSDSLRGYALLSPTLLVMAIAMCAPTAMMVALSFWVQSGFDITATFTLQNYEQVFSNPIFEALFLRTIAISGTCAVATVLIAYPMAYYVAFHVKKNKLVWVILMTLPFWTSYLLRVFAWKVVLGYNGAINSGLMSLGLISEPLEFLLYSPEAVVITLAHAWAAFAILPIYVSLEKIDRSLLEAASDLGDGPVARFFRVTLPLSAPGVIAALFLIFIPTFGDFVTPALVGGPDGLMLANIVQKMFGKLNNWPLGSALAIAMMAIVTILCVSLIWLSRKAQERMI